MLSLLYDPTPTSIHGYWQTIALTIWTLVGKVLSLLFNMLSRVVIGLLPRSKHLLISWLQSPSAVILEPGRQLLGVRQACCETAREPGPHVWDRGRWGSQVIQKFCKLPFGR